MNPAFTKDDPTEIRQYSTDKPKEITILKSADEEISTICRDEKQSRKFESNKSKYCEINEPC